MKTKSLLLLVIIWFLFMGGMLQAQQEKKQGEMTGAGQSSSEYRSYMGGKEHYMVDSPNYMAGKKHYLQGDPIPDSGKIIRGNEPISVSKGEMAPCERKESDDQGGTQIQININIIPEESTKGYGSIYLPVFHPKHHKGAGSLPPHVDSNHLQTGNFNPSESGGFRQGTINLR
jgi:hypothetical protein